MKTLKPLTRPRSLHISVQERLRGYIADNGLRPGEPLPPEAFFAQQLGVGRNSVREAIKALESIGIVETRRGVGVFVKEFSFQPLLDNLAYGLGSGLRDIEELREIRRVLEIGLIGRTVQLIPDEDVAELRATTERMRQHALRGNSFPDEDQKFHQLLFRCQNNRMLNSLLEIFWLAFYKASDFANLANSDPMATYRDHHEIVEAVAARDADKARMRLDEHYQGIMQVIDNNRNTSPSGGEDKQ